MSPLGARSSLLALALAGAFGATAGPSASIEDAARTTDQPVVFVFRLDDDAITPVTAQLIERAIASAEQHGATCLVVELDTPGGLVDSTRSVVKAILRARVPIVVWVPPGGRAASAGMFVVLASHVAAMAPGANIGAAHPVQIGGLPVSPGPEPEPKAEPPADEPERPTDAITEKVVQDTTAWARSLAQLRGRNIEWAASAVESSVSASTDEALQQGVVDLVALDIEDLLRRLDGREVALAREVVRLETAGARVETIEPWWGDRVLVVLSNPNVAFLLLMLGFYGILFELYSPGWGVAGTLGIILLVLAFFALAILPIDYVGLVLIALALGMFVAEVFVTSYGFLAIGGTACLVLGGLMLIDSPSGFLRVSLTVIVPFAVSTAAITVFLVGNIIRAHRRPVRTGVEAFVGATALAADGFSRDGERYSGTVRTHGEYWRASSPTPVREGQALEIEGCDGLTLRVKAVDAGPAAIETGQPATREKE